MLLMLANPVTNRLRYIADLMLRDMLGLEVKLTASQDEFRTFDGPRIAYTSEGIDGAMHITPAALLSENMITAQEIETSVIRGVPVLFGSGDRPGDLPFDPFAAGFYMVARYEEYLEHSRDRYGRYPVTESVAWKGGFLGLPVVQLWAAMTGDRLKELFPGITLRQPGYRYVPTFDVDHAFCYRGKPLARTLGGIGRSLLHGHLNDISRRVKVLGGVAADPFDTYDYIRQVLEPHGHEPLFFILFADYGGNDNNISVRSEIFRRLIRSLDTRRNLGVHPSLSSNKHYLKLQAECDGLSDLLDRDITMSRQHFLKLSLPKTYRALLQMGIRHDYSMGYASQPGFRAGVSMPYPFYDLVREEVTPLMIHPTVLMDVTMRDYLRLTPDKSLELAAGLINTVRSAGGEFTSLWHNESLSETGRWRGWRRVFEEMVSLASA